MNFQVPQFIEQEARIVGPLTLKQFLYIAVAGALSFIAFHIFDFFLWFMISIILGGVAVALAFLKINGQGFPTVLISALNFLWQPRTYTWQRKSPETAIDLTELQKIEALRNNITLGEKLKSAAMDITTGKFFSKTKTTNKTRYQTVTYMTGEKRMAKRIDY